MSQNKIQDNVLFAVCYIRSELLAKRDQNLTLGLVKVQK